MAKRAKSVASASTKAKKRTATMINEELVSTYLNRLQAALGDDRQFMPIFDGLRSDSSMAQGEVVALASRFVAKTPDSTSRIKALERILKRHQSLANFKLKQRAMGGRSAA